MLRYKGVFILILSIAVFLCPFWGKSTVDENRKPLNIITNISDFISIFPRTANEIPDRAACYVVEVEKKIDAIITIPEEERTFENTARALDYVVAYSDFAIFREVLWLIEMVHPDEFMRKNAHEELIKMNEFFVDAVTNNGKLYKAFKEYVDKNGKKEELNAERTYYLQQVMDDFKRQGLNLPENHLKEVQELNKKIERLLLDFNENIARDNRAIVVDRAAIEGLGDDFIDNLKRTDDGSYILDVNFSTYINVLTNCSVEDTRRQLFYAKGNRAYPANDEVLQKIIAKRDELALKLGFPSYAALELDCRMAKTPEQVHKFLDDLLANIDIKQQSEFDQLIVELPDSVFLTSEKKINLWNIYYAIDQYKKKHFDLDERIVAEYFPAQQTIANILNIYKQFFCLDFKMSDIKGLWHDDLQLVEVYDQEKKGLIGYLILDLYSRPNKYTLACQPTIVPAVLSNNHDELLPSGALILASFPRATPEKPSLLWEKSIFMFFHELGHVFHAFFGRTEMASFSGTSSFSGIGVNTKTDFIEMPSQLLEKWIWDGNVLRTISSHYKTGEPLPDKLIDKMLKMKNLSSGFSTQMRGFFAYESLSCYNSGPQVDLANLESSLAAKIMKNIQVEPNIHRYASFAHLSGYGARYYSYLWSEVYSLDLFSVIKEHGLFDPEIGRRFKNEVLAKGSSVEPIILLQAFLGRKPNQKAFLKDLGISA